MSASMDMMDEMKKTFKYFKKRKPPPDLSGVIDFSLHMSDGRIQPVDVQPNISVIGMSPSQCEGYGLKPLSDWQAYSLCDIPGFIYLQNPFLPDHQRYWIKRCLVDFPQKPNVCNLDAHMTLSDKQCLWDTAQGKKTSVESSSESTFERKTLLRQLRWVTFGYHHNWDTKVYQEDHYSTFPEDLACMTQLIAAVFGYETFKAQAAIVNYYHMDSTLGGHTDHSEFDMEMPIISYSFGQSAIFLLGGQTKQQTPTAMYLHSGDVILMGGSSRLAYHALPRVLPCADGQVPTCLRQVPEAAAANQTNKDTSDEVSIDSAALNCCRKADCITDDGRTPEIEKEGCKTCTCNMCNELPLPTIGQDSQRSSPASSEKRKCDRTTLGQKRAVSSDGTISQSTSVSPCSKRFCKTQGDSRLETGQSAKLTFEGLTNDNERNCGEHTTQAFSTDAEVKFLCRRDNWDPFVQYLSDSRINVSVRQVTKADGRFSSVAKT